MIGVVILKPTRDCNADCSYCSSPPDGEDNWTIDTFKKIFDRLEPNLSDHAVLIWHGGEPMLMGPQFYYDAWDYVQSKRPTIAFSIQSNILLYKNSRWFDLFKNVFKGSISTSFDPDEKNRTIKGNSVKYTKQFDRKIDELIDDKFFPLVIGTYSKETAPLAVKMYNRSLKYEQEGGTGFDIRVNYMYPIGRVTSEAEFISPADYWHLLIDLYDRWIDEVPEFNVVPLSEMLRKTIGVELVNKCPWTSKCGGTFIAIEPNGDCYNCSEFADLDDLRYSFGNIINGTLYGTKREVMPGFTRKAINVDTMGIELMTTPAARHHKRRELIMPPDCRTCDHFKECEGGCHRDSVLFDRGMGGKFYYCNSWMMVFERIKSSVISGEADRMIVKQGWTTEKALKHMGFKKDIIARG